MAEKNAIGKIVASLSELFNRSITVSNNDHKVYHNDADNLYPNRIELVEKNSTTASSAANKMKSFIIGKGFADLSFNDKIVNPHKRYSGYEFLELIADSVKTHKGCFVHINYDIEGKTNYLDVLKYKKCRISKEDDKANKGKIYYKDWDSGKKIGVKKQDEQFFYPFNNNNEVIMAQRIKDCELKGIKNPTPDQLVENYRGQVYFFNLEVAEIYPHAWVHPAYNDADSEFRLSLYRNTGYRTGFLDKTILIANGLDQESEKEFDKTVHEWLGAENSASVMLLNTGQQVPDPEKMLTAVSLKGTYDSKRFDNDEKALANNIRKAYLAIPKILIDPEDSFFGSSGESFRAAVEYYNSETLFIREKIAHMMDNFYVDSDFTILELGEYGQ